MAKHIYESSNILDVLNIEDPNNKVMNNTESSPQNENTEKLISSYGIKILEKFKTFSNLSTVKPRYTARVKP